MLIKVTSAIEYENPEQMNYEVVRGYHCEKCSQDFVETVKKTKKNQLHKCPDCHTELDSLILGTFYGVVKNEPTTLGQLAESNSKKIGKYKLEEMHHKEPVPEPFYGRNPDLYKKIGKMTSKDKRKYIFEGKL